MDVSFDAVQTALQNVFGSNYVNDFPAGGRMQHVIVSSDAAARMDETALMALTVPNAQREMVPLSAFARLHWTVGPVILARYNGYPALDISGRPAPGHTSGAAMAEIERFAGALPAGIAWDWTGQALQQTESERLTPLLLGLSALTVFMALAALYESWTVPLSVMLVVPLGIVGALAATMLRGMPGDIYFKVGIVTVIGLAAKNAILIVQFARERYMRGTSLRRAVSEAASARFRPVVMTSMAFLLGVLPLLAATGAGALSRRSVGTAVTGSIVAATVLGLVFAPLVFYITMTLSRARQLRAASRERKRRATARERREVRSDDTLSSAV
jgi:HAE1 family hydrophobic/amphiphilic exporter-1